MKKLFTLLFLTSFIAAHAQSADWAEVEKIFGRKGTAQGDVFKITFPRSDLKVKVGEVSIEPALALTSWIAFKNMESQAMMMGDLVLLDAEIAPVMSKLAASGIEVTALHNHIAGESPSIMYMHFGGEGGAIQLAEKMKAVLVLTGTPMTPPSPPSSTQIDWSKVEAMLGYTGQLKGNVLQFGIPRAEKITENGMEVPPFMGMSTAINFQSTGEGRAAITGDFVLTENEVNPVLRTLIKNGIAVTALHNHMLHETPRLFFMHFWANDDAQKLAKGLRAALDLTNSQPGK